MNKRQLWLGILIMALLCGITYSNHFNNAFHFDDAHTIQNNAYIRHISNVPLFFKDGSTSSTLPSNRSYRPVVTTSLAFDYWVGGGYYPYYFHLSTFILFILQGILMVFFLKHLFNISSSNTKTAAYAALIATTWYLLHPAIAETVNYIIARADMQSTLFVLLAFVLYIYSPFCRKTYLYNVAIIIGALAKPPAVMFAPMLFLYILLFEEKLSLADVFKKQSLKVFKKALPAFIICIGMYCVTATFTPKTWQAGGASPTLYLITQPFVILHYFAMWFVPSQLSADTDWVLLANIWNWRFFAGVLFIVAMLVIAFITSRKQEQRPISFGILWFFLALLPTSSIIPLAEVLNDHRMYFPFVGLCISVSWAVILLIRNYLPKYKAAFISTAALLLCGYAYGTWQRNQVWSTEETLWHDVTLKSPNNGRGLMNYGLTQMNKGNYPAAYVYFDRAMKLLPYYSSLYINRGVLRNLMGYPVKAEEDFIKAIQLGRDRPEPYFFYGRFLNQQKQYDEAIRMLQKTLALSPGYEDARVLLADAYNGLNSNVPPAAQKYIDQSLVYYKANNYKKCIELCDSALAIKPGYSVAYNNICAAYNKLKQWDKAIAAGQAGLQFNPNNKLLKNNLAEAYTHKTVSR